MKAALVALCLPLCACASIAERLPASPLKVCPVRYLNPLTEGEKRFVYVNLYSHRW